MAPTTAPATEEPIATETPVADDVVTGQIILPADAIIPPGATVSVQIQDDSVQDVEATVIGETVTVTPEVTTEGTIPFEVVYDPADIDAVNTYALRVRIEAEDGSLLYDNDTSTPVLTGGAPTTDVAVEVIGVGAPIDTEPTAEEEDVVAEGATESPSA
jgi:uncharacterized lipoprotein YbaY